MLLEKAHPRVMTGAGTASSGHSDPEALIEEARHWERRRRCKRAGLALAAVAVLVLAFAISWRIVSRVHSSGGDSPSLAASPNKNAGPSGPLYGISHPVDTPASPTSTIGRVSEKTLAFVGKRVHLGESFSPGPFSPGQKRLLLINGRYGAIRFGTSPLAIVDLRTMSLEQGKQARLRSDVGGGDVAAATWPTANRVLAVVAQRAARGFPLFANAPRETLISIDPTTGTIAWRHRLPTGILTGSGTVGKTTVLLFSASSRDPGRAVVITVTPNGATHSSSIQLERGGYENERSTVTRSAGSKPHVHVIKLGRRFEQDLVTTSGPAGSAYVLTGGGVIYSIDPASAKTTRHVVATPAGSPDTSPQDMLTDAAPLDGKLVVSSFFPRADGATRAGIYLIDPATWTARLVTPTTPSWLTSHNQLLAFTDAGQFGRSTASWTRKGTGINIYDANGELQHHLEATQAFNSVVSTPLFDYAVLPALPPTYTTGETTAQADKKFAAMRFQALLFDPDSGKILGNRTITYQAPALLQPAAEKQHR